MNRPGVITLLLVGQLMCASFLMYDILSSVLGLNLAPINWQLYEFIQIATALGLVFGAIFSAVVLRKSLRDMARLSGRLRVASGAFMDVLEDSFEEWGLTPAEKDVALFAIKGLSTREIAELRDTSEGTVKAQTNAIYKKAGVSGRSQLLSLFIDDLMSDVLVAR